METPARDAVRSVMTGRVLAVTADTGIDTALRVMTQARVQHLPVMRAERCIGLLRETDILWTLWTHGPDRQTAGGCCKPVPTVNAEDPITVAAALIGRDGGDAALVTANGSIVGILTAADIVHYLGEQADA